MVATGNWGCGAFNGNLQLKAVIQYIAAAQVRGMNRTILVVISNSESSVHVVWMWRRPVAIWCTIRSPSDSLQRTFPTLSHSFVREITR